MNSYSISSNDNFPYELEDTSKPDDVYVYVKFLGEGSFGKVNLYQNTSDNNSLVVWKEINLKRLDAKKRNEAFQEVEILAMLDHPNIIAYFKHFIGDDTLYIELEYAKCGTLTNLIKQQKNLSTNFDLETVVWYFYQLTSAINYIHEMGIMHRDIKALNIFVMQSGILKLGDFGIAKVFYDKLPFTESIVGTPLYMSPEIIEGKKYTFSSDIWSLGCVVYEVLTLSHVFEATNQLKLALKITCFDVEEINFGDENGEIENLIKKLLSKDPCKRPTAKEILKEKLFSERQDDFNSKSENLNLFSKKYRNTSFASIPNDLSSNSIVNSNTQNAIIASKLSQVYQWGAGKLLPQPVEFFQNSRAPFSVALGPSHFCVITLEKELYTWAASHGNTKLNYAKLGHGKNFGTTRNPKKVEFDGVAINQVACGDNFTMVVDEHGDLYTFGTDYLGCLGLGGQEELDSENSIYSPTKVLFFVSNSLSVSKIACGEAHCIALVESEDKDRIFTWGCGEHGRLGHGDEKDENLPKEIIFQANYKFKNIYAGTDCSFLITREGKVLAFGNNEYNKLLLNPKQIGFKNSDFETSYKETSNINQQMTPKLIKLLSPYNIVKISSGFDHTAVIDAFGRLWTFGSNRMGQLGVGDLKQRTGLNLISGNLCGQHVINVACGDSFTICCTSENQVFSFGNYKDGRLGLDSNNRLESNVLSPKPIFGTLHLVSEMCCCHWTSLVIAEQMLNSKPVRSISFANYMNKKSSTSSPGKGPDSPLSQIKSLELEQKEEINISDELPVKFDIYEVENEENSEDIKEDSLNEYSSEVPDWLKKDLDEASFIPMEALEKKPQINNKENSESVFAKRLQEALEEIEKLKKENSALKEENKMLKEKLSH